MQSNSTASTQSAGASQSDPRSGKYLIFKLGPEEFGVRVIQVREIMGIQQITAVPQMPDYLKGVMNLRGEVIPVIDMRLKFGLPAAEHTSRTCIVVVQTGGETAILTGIIVDAVSEVVNVTASDIAFDIEDTAHFGAKFETRSILGRVKLKGKVKILLDIDREVSTHEIARLHGLVAQRA